MNKEYDMLQKVLSGQLKPLNNEKIISVYPSECAEEPFKTVDTNQEVLFMQRQNLDQPYPMVKFGNVCTLPLFSNIKY